MATRLIEALEAFQKPRHPLRILTLPPDAWAGSAETGRALLTALRDYPSGYDVAIAAFWRTTEDDATQNYRHGFRWLRDLRACGGDMARRAARHLIESWIETYGRQSGTTGIFDAALTGARLAAWVQHFDFYGASADTQWQDIWMNCVFRQGRHLARSLPSNHTGPAALQAITGLLLAGLSLSDQDDWLHQTHDMLQTELAKQILGDGGHVTRSPAQLLLAYMRCHEIRVALVAAGRPVPAVLIHALDRMGPALRFFRCGDKKLPCFHATQEEDADRLDHYLASIDTKGKVLRTLPACGYDRLSSGRSLLLFDHGLCPPAPYDRQMHAAPLAFEFSYARERIFVNCGTHPSAAEWQDALRATAAHNSLTIDDYNAMEIRQDGHFGRIVRKAMITREDTEAFSMVEGSHDGYVSTTGITHHRRLSLAQKGHDLRGEETLSCATQLAKPRQVTLRFHLHPRVLVSAIRDGQEFLLRLPSGIGWRFHQTGATLSLENSIYLGEGNRPLKTKQIVLTSTMQSDKLQICWALQREGL
ncbi:MAG: heparinase II/III family protein [Pseudomonadota bacterium]